MRDLPELELLAAKLAAQVERDGAPEAARAIRSSYLKALRELEDLSKTFAAEVTTELRAAERQTRVRPDTGGDGGHRLEDALEATPLPALPGSIGFANETLLYQEVPWWWTNEEGFSGLVGNTVPGHFYDSGFTNPSAPGEAASRTHPLFRAEKGPPMMIQNPIPARRFVESTVTKMEPVWHERVAAIRSRLDAEWQAALNVAKAQVLAAFERGQLP